MLCFEQLQVGQLVRVKDFLHDQLIRASDLRSSPDALEHRRKLIGKTVKILQLYPGGSWRVVLEADNRWLWPVEWLESVGLRDLVQRYRKELHA